MTIPSSPACFMASELWSALSSRLTLDRIGLGLREGSYELVPVLSSWHQMMWRGWRDSCWPPPRTPSQWPPHSLLSWAGRWLAQQLPKLTCLNPLQGHIACKQYIKISEGKIWKTRLKVTSFTDVISLSATRPQVGGDRCGSKSEKSLRLRFLVEQITVYMESVAQLTCPGSQSALEFFSTKYSLPPD